MELEEYKNKDVVIIYHEIADSKPLTLKGFCFDVTENFLHIRTYGESVTSIRKKLIDKIKGKFETVGDDSK